MWLVNVKRELDGNLQSLTGNMHQMRLVNVNVIDEHQMWLADIMGCEYEPPELTHTSHVTVKTIKADW